MIGEWPPPQEYMRYSYIIIIMILMINNKYVNSPGLRPSGVLDLQYGSLELVLNLPPAPLPAGLGARMCEGQSRLSSSGPSIFRSFFRFDFGLVFGLDFGSSWARLGLLLPPFWEPKSSPVGPTMRPEPFFLRKCRFLRNVTFSNTFLLFLTPGRGPDRLKTDPRRVQER